MELPVGYGEVSPSKEKMLANARVSRFLKRSIRLSEFHNPRRYVACVMFLAIVSGLGAIGALKIGMQIGYRSTQAEAYSRMNIFNAGQEALSDYFIVEAKPHGNKFCIIQPTLSAGKETWSSEDIKDHIALRAFLRTFASTVTSEEKEKMKFAIYYGHDSDDAVFGDAHLRQEFEKAAWKTLHGAGFRDNLKLVFGPLYGLHGRVNAIWNMMVKDAYHDGCDYFFMSNDDMVFFTPGWVTAAVESLNGIGPSTSDESTPKLQRPCRKFGTVRFRDQWAPWATYTFHVSTRLHVEIFDGTYYPVPYISSHNDFWIYKVYEHFNATEYRGDVKVRNRIINVDAALASPFEKHPVARPRYEYDPMGPMHVYIREGREQVQRWLNKNKNTDRCEQGI